KGPQRLDGRHVGDAIDSSRTEVALERGDYIVSDAVKLTGWLHPITVAREQPLRLLDRRIAVAKHVDRTIRNDRRRLHPEPDPRVVQGFPGKLLARILLARGRDVGVRHHTVGRNAMTREDAATERGHCRDLSAWKFRIAVVVSWIGDLD